MKNLLESGYEEITDRRVRNPYSHLIYHILKNVKEEQRHIYPELNDFYNKYVKEELPK